MEQTYLKEQLIEILGAPASEGEMPQWNAKFGPQPAELRRGKLEPRFMNWNCAAGEAAKPATTDSDASSNSRNCLAVSPGVANGKRLWALVTVCDSHADQIRPFD